MDAGIPDQSLVALKLLTHAKNEPYLEYVQRISTNAIARMVKLADIRDNTHPDRTDALPGKVRARLTAKYAAALEVLA